MPLSPASPRVLLHHSNRLLAGAAVAVFFPGGARNRPCVGCPEHQLSETRVRAGFSKLSDELSSRHGAEGAELLQRYINRCAQKPVSLWRPSFCGVELPSLRELPRQHPPPPLARSYFAPLIAAVVEHGGDVLKFAGDAFIAVWRAPADGADDGGLSVHVRAAVRCCIAILCSLDEYEVAHAVAAPAARRVAVALAPE